MHQEKIIWFIRHGQTAANQAGIWLGQTDPELNRLGREQSAALSSVVNRLQIDICLSSDLKRACQTADIMLAKHPDICRKSDERLREVSWGEADGLLLSDIRGKYGQGVFNRWRSAREADLSFCLPGGESKRDALERISGVIAQVVDNDKLSRVALVTHGGLIALYLQHVVGLSRAFSLENGAVVGVRVAHGKSCIHLEHT